MASIAYDEFGLFHENAAEYGLVFPPAPTVRRVAVHLADERKVSALVWGEAPPVAVFVHGGSQNAHTWDTVLMALGTPAVAVDLPGHGHSDWRDDGAYRPATMADDIAVAVREFVPGPVVVVGMSLGGLTSMELALRHPDLVSALVMVDITPGVNREKAKQILDFVEGPQVFPDFEALLARTVEFNPTRSVSSLRRGILHNAHQSEDGSWAWRYDRRGHRPNGDPESDAANVSHQSLWDDFGALTCPVTLLRGEVSPVVDDADVAEARRRQPGLRVEVVAGAGHSIQGDRPLELAELLRPMLTH